MKPLSLLTALLAVLVVLPAFGQAQSPALVRYQFPVPDAQFVSPQTTIGIRPGGVLDGRNISPGEFLVVGTVSGLHSGVPLLSDDRQTVIFTPDRAFSLGERVAVVVDGLRRAGGDPVPSQKFSFSITGTSDQVRLHTPLNSVEMPAGSPAGEAKDAGRARILSTDTLPGDFPKLNITAFNHPTPGNLYLADFSTGGGTGTGPYLMVLDNSTTPVFYRKVRGQVTDFKRHPNGTMTYYDYGMICFYQMDSTYTVIDSFRCGNGYHTDPHDFMLLPNGHVLLMGLDVQTVDMSKIVTGGNPKATVIGAVIQELDNAKHVVFEWRSFDHFQITDATHENLKAASIDYVHHNAIDVDTDGNILLSCRHMDEITKIDRLSGEIIWRWGGKHNMFTFTNDTLGFSHQHDIRCIANGHYTLFDNGNYHSTTVSRALEYQLDETRMTATLVWQFHHSPEIYGNAMGSVQRLSNGHTLIGWGMYPKVTEVDSTGAVAYDLDLPTGYCSYRAYRFPGATSSVVSLISPWSGSTQTPIAPTMEWRPVTAASSYYLQVARDGAFKNRVVDDSMITGTQHRVKALAEGTLYYWRVRPKLDSGTSVWSEPWAFRTALATIQLSSPPDRDTDVAQAPALTWKGSPAAGLYHLQVSSDSLFASLVFDDSAITTPSQGLVGLDYSTRYYWRVQAWSDTATSEWSEVWTFETVPPPAATELIAPSDASQGVPISPELIWNRVPDAIGYRIQISNWDPYFQSIVVDDSTTATSYRAAGLDSNTRYYWRVLPIVPGIASPWSTTWYFTTAAPYNLLPTTQIYPLDKSRIGSDSIRFIWASSPVPLATYRLEISYDDTFARSFIDSTLADTTALLSAGYFGQQEYWWRVWVIDPAGKEVSSTEWSFQTVSGTSSVGGAVASEHLRLDQNIPNPAGDMTMIAFRLPLRQHLVLRLLDLNGNELQRPVDATLDAGQHTVELNTRDLASGTYLCLLTTEGGTLAQRVIVLH